MGKFTEYKLPLKSMPEGMHQFEYHLTKEFFVNMESTEVRNADLNVGLSVEHKRDVYYLHFVVEGTVTVACDRCLDDLVYPIETEYSISVKYGEDYNDESDSLLIIPESDNYLNVAYMLYDTVELAIPIKHVHPMGKCNRQMSAVLKKHRAGSDEDAELEESLIEEMDTMEIEEKTTDPRWDALKGLSVDNE